MDVVSPEFITAIHQAGRHCVLALSGGGSLAAGQLLSVAGASRSIVEIVIPYHSQALADFLGHAPPQSCAVETSKAMAQRAYDRGRWLVGTAPVLGLGGTASLVSDRPKRGEHRVHVSCTDGARMQTWSLVLNKSARDRAGEERVAAALVLHALARSLNVSGAVELGLSPPETIEESVASGLSLPWPVGPEPLFFAEDGQLQRAVKWQRENPMALVPGSFNPLHAGHCRLAQAAARMTGLPVAFEISIANVDKPDVGAEEARHRLGQFAGHAPVWLTRAPRFIDKARLFPGATFAIGVDTAVRLLDPSYYDGADAMRVALETIAELGCRFLVGGRADDAGRFLTLADLAIPEPFREIFADIPPDLFRWDVSSSALRNRGAIWDTP